MSPPGSHHEHIESVRCINEPGGATTIDTVAAMVQFIDGAGYAYTLSGSAHARVGVVRPTGGRPYIRTYADGTWTDNLLSLPRF
jgi:hypothetical protein